MISYMSVGPQIKSVKERCIRVATIDIAIIEGGWRIYVTDGHENTIPLLARPMTRTILSGSSIRGGQDTT